MVATFQTYEGRIVYRSKHFMYSAANALKKAAVLGFSSLVAVEPNGRRHDYTEILHRDYLSKVSPFKVAA